MAFASGWAFLMLMFAGSGGGVPLGVPPLPDDPILAKVAPEECLLYFSSAGMAKPDPESTNQTEKLFAEPEIQKAVADLDKLIRARLKESAKKGNPQQKAAAEAAPTLVKALLTRPLAVYVSEIKTTPKGGPQFRGGAILSLGDDGDEIKAAFEKLFFVVLGGGGRVPVNIGGTAFDRLPTPGGPEFLMGAKGKYYYISTGEGEMEALLKRADGSAPKWLTALHKQKPVDHVSTVMMLNAHGVIELVTPLGGPEVPKVLESLGVKDLDRVVGVTGLDKEGMVSRSLVSFKGDPKGIFQLFEQKPLTAVDLDLIPNNATFAFALKLDTGKAWSTILDIVEKIDPKAKEKLLQNLGDQGKELLDETFKALGDAWCVFDSPTEGGLFTGAAAAVSIKDADAVASLQKKLIAMMEGGPGRVQEFDFNGKTVHVFTPREKGFPLAPSWCLTDKHLIVAPYPGAIKGFLQRGKTFQGLSTNPDVARALEGEGQTMMASYVNMQRLFDLLYPMAPVFFHMMANQMRSENIDLPPDLLPSAGSIRRHLRPSVGVLRRTPRGLESVAHQTLPGGQGLASLPILAGLMVPAVQKTRDAARRAQSMNNLRQMSLAMLNMADSNQGVMPAAAIYSKEGKPFLSWRVQILPYIEEEKLYKEFHLDEPWDSEHNKKLVARMPAIYAGSNRKLLAEGKTTYLAPVGKETMFPPGPKGVRLADVTNGASILLVEADADHAVTWTKPEDLKYDPKQPRAGLAVNNPGGFLVLFVDGSIHTLPAEIDPDTLRAWFARAGGEKVPRP